MTTFGFAGPRDLPPLRDEVLAFDRNRNKARVRTLIDQGWELPHPFGDDDEAGVNWLTGVEAKALRLGELFYVTPAMTHLAASAAATLPDFVLQREDLPSEFGLMVFGAPICQLNQPIAAVAWGVSAGHRRNPSHRYWSEAGIWLTFYSDPVDRMPTGTPRLAYADVGAWPFHADPEAATPDPSIVGLLGLGPAMRLAGPTLKAAWLLMQQPISAASTVEPDRAARRRALRAGRSPQSVRVISLRTSASQAHSDRDREYLHRWVVRGHWRNQWLPSRRVHRPIWINAHIKGDAEQIRQDIANGDDR